MWPVWYVCDNISALKRPLEMNAGGWGEGKWWNSPALAFNEEQQPCRKTSAAAESRRRRRRTVDSGPARYEG